MELSLVGLISSWENSTLFHQLMQCTIQHSICSNRYPSLLGGQMRHGMRRLQTLVHMTGSVNPTHMVAYSTSMAQHSLTLTFKVLNFWKFTSYCSLKPLWSGMGEVVPARTSPTLHPPSPPTVHQLLQLALEELMIWWELVAAQPPAASCLHQHK